MPQAPASRRVPAAGRCVAALIALAGCQSLDPDRWARGPNEAESLPHSASAARPRTVRMECAAAVLFWEGGADAPVVRVRINGRTLYALVDTGSAVSLLEARAARRCGVVERRSETTNGFKVWPGQGLGAAFEARPGFAEEVRLGAIVVSNVPVMIARGPEDQRPWAGGAARRAEGIIGVDLLQKFGRMEWDGAAGVIRLGGAVRPVRGAVHAVQLLGASTLPMTKVQLGGRELAAALDTGADFAVYVPGPLSRAAGFPPPEGRVVLAHGMGGPVVVQRAGEVHLVMGGMDFGMVPLWVGATGQGHAHLPFALIGRGVLGRRRFVIDWDTGWLWLFGEKVGFH